MSTSDRVIAIISELTDMELTPQTELESIGLDSMDRWELLTMLEEDFSIEIPDQESPKWKSIQECAEFIDACICP